MNKEREPRIHREAGLRIMEEVSIVAREAGARSCDVMFSDDGALRTEIKPKNGINGSGSKDKNNHNDYPQKGRKQQATSQEEPQYSLSEVAATLGVVAQHILNLINRFDVIQPKKSSDYAPRETYVFTREEVAKVEKFFKIRENLYKPVREAVEMLQHDADYTHAAKKLQKALKEYDDDDAESWMEIVEALSLIPSLTPQERDVLLLIELEKKTPLEVGVQLGIKSETRVLRLLETAQSKAGKGLFDLYKFLTEL